MPNQTGVLVALGGCLIVFLLRSLQVYVRWQLYIRKHGCQPAPGLPQTLGLFGFDVMQQTLRAFREDRPNASMKEQFRKYGDTFASKVFGTTKICTLNPKNIQHAFSTDFASWGVQPLREFYFGPFIGEGVLTTDGHFWQHSRALVRPAFTQNQIADLSSFDTHIQRLFNLLPKDGSEVDLAPLFNRLALDSSTEYIFGESLACLSPNNSLDAVEFLDAYKYGQVGIGRRIQTLQWNILTWDRRFWKSCKVARDFVGKYVDEAIDHYSRSKPQQEKPRRYVIAHRLAEETKDREDILN